MNKALVVDDSLMIPEVFTAYLQSAGFIVEKACNVEQAQQTLTTYHPDPIVLDVVMDGNRSTCSIPVIICSTKTTQADLMLGDLIGADAYLGKRVQQAEFVSKARQLSQKPAVCKLIS